MPGLLPATQRASHAKAALHTTSKIVSRCPCSLHAGRPRSHRFFNEANNVAQRGVAA